MGAWRARLGAASGIAVGLLLTVPASVAAHSMNATYESRLPLAVYLVGAATTVALSFLFVITRDVRAAAPAATTDGDSCRRSLSAAASRRSAWSAGPGSWSRAWPAGPATATSRPCSCGSTAGSGWPSLSAVIGPVWHFLDPFSTLHDVAAAILDRLGVRGWPPADYPARLGRWPATIGFAVFVWLELVLFAGPSTLFVVLVGYTAFTLAMMAQFGRDEWRSRGETFTVWFRLLGRLAPFALVDEDGRVRRRSLGSGLLEPGWTGPT